MDLVVLVAVVFVVAIVAAAVVFARGERARAEAAMSLARLAETADHLRAAQAEIAGRLQQAQAGLGERLEALSKRLGDGLDQHAEKTGATLRDLYVRMATIDSAQKNLSDLAKQVVGLQDILANKQARGAFGQVRLEDLVQDALPPGAYEFQASLGNDRRVDCLVKLPKPPGPVAIDAKFPLEAYRAMHAAAEAPAKIQAQRAFAADVRGHVKDIAERYLIPGETAEWALMFLPSEAIYGELLINFAEVVEEARRLRVAIVSPNTLWAVLNTVRAILRDAQMVEQAGRIQTEVEKLVADVRRLDERVGNLRKHFVAAEGDIDEILISTRKIVRSGEKIREMEIEDEAAAGTPPAALPTTEGNGR